MTITSMSELEFKTHYSWVDKISSDLSRSKRKGGLTWGQRVSIQRIANEKAKLQGYYPARKKQFDIETDPINIERWRKEARVIADIEAKKNALIKLEKERLAKLEKERLNKIKIKKEKLAKIKKAEFKIVQEKKEKIETAKTITGILVIAGLGYFILKK